MRTPRRSAATPPDTPVRGRRAHAGPPADEGPDGLPDRASETKSAPDMAPETQRLPDTDSGTKRLSDTAPGTKRLSDPAPESDDSTNAAPEAGPPRAGRRHLRPRTVRAKIVCLLMVPVVSLLALWGYATVSTAQDVSRLRRVQRVDAEVRAPVAAAIVALQAERAVAVPYATESSAGRRGDLERLAKRTDRAVAALRLGDDGTVADGQELPAQVARRLEAFVGDAERLRSLREAVRERRTGWRETYERYTATVSAAFAVNGALTGIQDAHLGSDARVLLEFSRAGEALAQEDVLLASTRPGDGLPPERLRLFTGAVATRRALTASAATDLRGTDGTAWRRLAASAPYAALGEAEDDILAKPPGTTRALRPATSWNGAHARVQGAMRTIEQDAARGVADRADPFTRGALSPAGAAVLLGLAAVAASLVISVRIGRGLVVELVSLRNRALEIARRELPAAMRRLRAGEEIDIGAEAPPGPRAEDETGQVAEALGTVHRAALRATVERAELASGISGVFVNLARRSQILVHRQLSLLDSMERRSDDPNELGDLFRLDHLTTRMRRHAESLIILSGAAPGRAWRMPVPLTNVVRAAVSEVEDYARVEARQLPEAKIIGAAVADLTHLLAEIIENAAQFSPPHTRVRVTGEPVGNGYALEVEDRGLGMGKETLAEANRRIAQSEALDLFDSDRLGLFVVSRLAARHDIRVHLRTSPYGGTTAVVLLPTALLHREPPERTPEETADARQPAAHTHARVPDDTHDQPHHPSHHRSPDPRAVAPSADRPALAAPFQTTAEPTTGQPPPGVTALRPHRPQDNPEDSDDLPRRVRQASLAPQLRERPATQPPPAPEFRGDDQRTPELARDRMAAYRDGWSRGGGRHPGHRAAPAPAPGSHSDKGDPA
ncbi:sensor histidine kinase [Streptomyces flavalbus]|uniref:histidine kinase n=1 Tax=Streptomyces flavalbus TaxID=2665155 RepID=A0ABW2W357_9ACTN